MWEFILFLSVLLLFISITWFIISYSSDKRLLGLIFIVIMVLSIIGLSLSIPQENKRLHNSFMDTSEVYTINVEDEVYNKETDKFKIIELHFYKKKYYIKGMYNKKKYIVNIDEDLYSILDDNYGTDIEDGKTYSINLKLDNKIFYIDDLTYKKYTNIKADGELENK